MTAQWSTREQLHGLVGELTRAPHDARWATLAREVGNPAVGPLLRAALGAAAPTALGDVGPDGSPRDYLGAPLACRNVVAYDREALVGPIDGLIGAAVRPLGGANSSSGAADGRPFGTLLDTALLPSAATLRPLDDGALRPGVDHDAYARVPGGLTLRALNALLDAEHRAVENLPAYMDLTVAGALATSAHGSGAGLGPLCDLVASITLVQADGRRVRVEPTSNPITDAAAWARLHPTALPLVCADRDFYAVVVGVGCMGVVEEVVLRVVPAFLLSEVHAASTWSRVKADLAARRFLDWRHYEVLVSPYTGPGEADPICAVLTRQVAERIDRPLAPGRRPSELAAAVFPGLGDVLERAAGRWRGFGPLLARGVVEIYGFGAGASHDVPGQRVGGPSFEVLDLGGINGVNGVAAEIAFVLPGGDPAPLVAAVEGILARAEAERAAGGWVHTLPISIRFTRASPHLLAIEHGDPARDVVALIEMLALHDVEGFAAPIDAFQRASLGVGRPHWGQRNDQMRDARRLGYPGLDAWLAVRAERDPDGRFGNAMTDSFGLTRPPAPPAVAPVAAPAPGPLREVENRFFLPCTADRFAEVFLDLKSRESRFGPLELVRAPGRQGQPFVVGERFEGRMRLDYRLRAALLRSPLPDRLERLVDSALRLGPAERLGSLLAARLAANRCRITSLRPRTTPDGPPEAEYEFLPGSPITGSIRFRAVDVAGGCLVTHRLRYAPVDAVQRAVMEAFGLRLTLVVAYVEVEAAARALRVGMATDLRRPSDDEACRPLPASTRRLPLDEAGVVAVKRDVRRFDVDADADAFARAFHHALSNVERFGFFAIVRDDRARPFRLGDRFRGVMTVTPALAADLRALRLPPGLRGRVARALARPVEAGLIALFRHDPPTDFGVITALRPAEAPRFVRYDYLEGTPIAGYTTFEVDARGEGGCRVTQTFVYQEQQLATASVFGTFGLYLHNRVVTSEVAYAAEALGVAWRALDPTPAPPTP